MAVRDLIALVTFQIKTDKLVHITKTETNGDETDTGGTIRAFTVDFSPRKAFALLGLYIGVVNAQAPAIFLEIVRTFIGG